jgi:hypothetical protein
MVLGQDFCKIQRAEPTRLFFGNGAAYRRRIERSTAEAKGSARFVEPEIQQDPLGKVHENSLCSSSAMLVSGRTHGLREVGFVDDSRGLS